MRGSRCPHPQDSRHRATRAGRESGVSAIEFVLLTPLLFFLLFATVQFAVYFFARHVAIAAAQEGDRVARAEAANPGRYPNWTDDAQNQASAWIAQLAPNLLTNAYPKATSSGNSGQQGWTVTVTVTAQLPSLFGSMTVTESSTGPVEQFIQDPTAN